jgi:hypothetical protein
MSAKEIPISKPSRIIKQQAEATIQNLIDAVVELVTNCDDSYSRLEGVGKNLSGKIEIYVSREKGGRCKEFKIRDHAEGMTKEKLEKAIGYGEESSGFIEGKTVRGLLGRGLKESILGLGEGEIYTKTKESINCVKIWWDERERKALYDFLDNFDKKDSDINKFINSEGDGTLIKIVVKNEKIKIPEGNKLGLQIADHYALRDITSSENREIILTFEDFGRNRTKTSSPIKFIPPEGELIIDKSLSLPRHKDLIQLRVWESPESLPFQRYNPCSKAGILIKTKGAILDNSLFKYDNDPAAFYFWGEIYCEGIADRLIKAAKEGKESEIIDLTRKGLNWRSDYGKEIQGLIENHLSPLIQKKKKALESGKRKTISRSTKEMFKNICKLLDKLARQEFKEWEGPQDPRELVIDSLVIIPSKANIETDEPRTLSIYAPKKLIQAAGTKTVIMSESSDIKIVFPGTKRLTMYLTVDLKPHPKDPNIYYNFFKVRGRGLGKESFISCKLGNQETRTLVVVKKPTKKKKRKSGFISEIISSELSNPIQRVEYEGGAGIIKIYVRFPGVARYFPSGLNEVEQKEESRVMLAELIGEAFCRVLARKKLETGGNIASEGQIDAFNSEVNEYQRKYLDKIHEIILRWKFK